MAFVVASCFTPFDFFTVVEIKHEIMRAHRDEQGAACAADGNATNWRGARRSSAIEARPTRMVQASLP